MATGISQHMIDTLPQVSQNFLEFAGIVPGMISGVQRNGNASPRARTHGINNVNVYIGDVGQKTRAMNGIAGPNVSQNNPCVGGLLTSRHADAHLIDGNMPNEMCRRRDADRAGHKTSWS